MSASAAPNPIFQTQSRPEPRDSAEGVARSTAAGDTPALRALTQKFIVLAGLALFGCALVVAFRVIALDAGHQLEQPGLDFAICGAIGFLGLTISWIHLGERQSHERARIEDLPQEASAPSTFTADAQNAIEQPLPAVPLSSASPELPPATAATKRPTDRRHWVHSHACPFCNQKMQFLGSSRYSCSACGHVEDRSPVSFLDGILPCDCLYCRRGLPAPLEAPRQQRLRA